MGCSPETSPERLPLHHVLSRYFNDYAVHRPSVDQIGVALDRWKAFFGSDAMVIAVLDRRRRAEFVQWLQHIEFTRKRRNPGTGEMGEVSRRLSASTVRRAVEQGNAALQWAKKEGLLSRFEPVPLPEKGQPRTYAPTLADFVKLWDATDASRLRLFIALLVHTIGRPEALLELTSWQCDYDQGSISLNAEGRQQSKKRRPTIPMTDGIRPWLLAAPRGRLIQHKGKPVKSLIGIWRLTVEAAGLDPRFTPKTVQKLMTRELRKRGVSLDLIGPYKGNTNPLNRVAEAHYGWVDVDLLKPVAKAIDELWREIGEMAVQPISPEATLTTPENARSNHVPGGTFKAANPLKLVEPIGIEPTTSTVQTSRSPS